MLRKQIARLRKAAGLNQTELADRIGTSTSAIGMYEQGRRCPSVEVLILLAREFNVSLDYLITGREYPSSISDEVIVRFPKDCPCNTCYWGRRIFGSDSGSSEGDEMQTNCPRNSEAV